MSDLDRTARETIRRTPTDFLTWALPTLSSDLVFRRWLDTEASASHGEPRRRSDTVMELTSQSGTNPPWLLVIEVESRRRAAMNWRSLDYLLRHYRTHRHGPHRRDRYEIGVLVVYLSGRAAPKLRMTLPGTDSTLRWKPATCAWSNRTRPKHWDRLSAANGVEGFWRGCR